MRTSCFWDYTITRQEKKLFLFFFLIRPRNSSTDSPLLLCEVLLHYIGKMVKEMPCNLSFFSIFLSSLLSRKLLVQWMKGEVLLLSVYSPKNNLVSLSTLWWGFATSEKILRFSHDLARVFRPPFINGRPQDSDSVLEIKAITPIFWVKVSLFSFASFASFASFSFTSFVRGHFICFSFAVFLKRSHQGSPGHYDLTY